MYCIVDLQSQFYVMFSHHRQSGVPQSLGHHHGGGLVQPLALTVATEPHHRAVCLAGIQWPSVHTVQGGCVIRTVAMDIRRGMYTSKNLP